MYKAVPGIGDGSISFSVHYNRELPTLFQAFQPLWLLLCNPADETEVAAKLPPASDCEVKPTQAVPVGMVTFLQNQKVRLARQRLGMNVPPEEALWRK